MKHKGTVRIETPRLILRAFVLDDVEPAFRNWESDERVTEYLRWTPMKDICETEQVLKNWIEGYAQQDFYQWAIAARS